MGGERYREARVALCCGMALRHDADLSKARIFRHLRLMHVPI